MKKRTFPMLHLYQICWKKLSGGLDYEWNYTKLNFAFFAIFPQVFFCQKPIYFRICFSTNFHIPKDSENIHGVLFHDGLGQNDSAELFKNFLVFWDSLLTGTGRRKTSHFQKESILDPWWPLLCYYLISCMSCEFIESSSQVYSMLHRLHRMPRCL